MRFANIIYNKRNKRMNLGDDMQLLAIENLYRMMNINYRDVVRIEFSDLYTWDGEELLVPISFPIYSYNSEMRITCFSSKICPVFLALSIFTDVLDSSDIEYLKRFSPIGCRDYRTLCTMKKYDIDAYLFGCMTLTFPRRRKINDERTQVFCVDVPDKLSARIPHQIKKNCVFMTNMCYMEELDENPEEKEREIYNRLIDEAGLVITARLHIALPCVAAGIPVVFAKDLYSYRFTGVDRIVKIYSEEEYDSINWNPKPVEYEDIKEKMINLAISRVYDKVEKYTALMADLDACLANRGMREGKVEYAYYTEKYLQSIFSYNDCFDYIIWAVTQTAEVVYNLISAKWKNARLVAVVDKGKKVIFHGKISATKEVILKNRNAVILVCSGAAIGEARDYFEENEIFNYFYCCKNDLPLK